LRTQVRVSGRTDEVDLDGLRPSLAGCLPVRGKRGHPGLEPSGPGLSPGWVAPGV